MGPVDLAVIASDKLLDKIGMDKSEIDFVVFATSIRLLCTRFELYSKKNGT